LAALLRESKDELAYLEAISMGKPVATYLDSTLAADEFDFFSESGTMSQGATSLHTPGYVNMTFRQPYGVVAAIIPWNFPLVFFAHKAAPALMAGNTMVLKSSEKAPLTVSPNKTMRVLLKSDDIISLPKLHRWSSRRDSPPACSMSFPDTVHCRALSCPLIWMSG
jgi:aldehyde dehydrogenase (NAD+)